MLQTCLDKTSQPCLHVHVCRALPDNMTSVETCLDKTSQPPSRSTQARALYLTRVEVEVHGSDSLPKPKRRLTLTTKAHPGCLAWHSYHHPKPTLADYSASESGVHACQPVCGCRTRQCLYKTNGISTPTCTVPLRDQERLHSYLTTSSGGVPSLAPR